MNAPDLTVQLSTGEQVPLSSLYAEKPLALVFVRHFGCVFCRDHMKELSPLNDLNIVYGAMGTPEQAEEIKALIKSPHRFISDPNRELYRAFEVKAGRPLQVLNFRTFAKGMQAVKRGVKFAKPESDPWQLGGTFVIDTSGKVQFAHYAKDAADNLSPADIRSVMDSLEEV